MFCTPNARPAVEMVMLPSSPCRLLASRSTKAFRRGTNVARFHRPLESAQRTLRAVSCSQRPLVPEGERCPGALSQSRSGGGSKYPHQQPPRRGSCPRRSKCVVSSVPPRQSTIPTTGSPAPGTRGHNPRVSSHSACELPIRHCRDRLIQRHWGIDLCLLL